LGAVDTVATIFGIGILSYFVYKVVLPKLNELGNAVPPTPFPAATAAATFTNSSKKRKKRRRYNNN
jgi:hypothetical protein